MTMTTTDRISRVWHTIADFPTKTTSWPDPETSIGIFYRELGKTRCWELTGPGLEQYRSLAKDVKEHLEQYGQKETATVLWSAYMVGRSPEVARPTVFFCSRQADSRKRVRKIIHESGILEKYPGFRTSDSNRPPDMDQLIKLAGCDSAGPVGSLCTCGCPTGLCINTLAIQPGTDSQYIQNTATIGAIVCFEESLCFTTVAHAFGTDDLGIESQDDSDFEFDLDDELEIEADDERQTECGILPAQQAPDFRSGAETPRVQLDNISQSAPTTGPGAFFSGEEVAFSSLNTTNPFLDYALVPLKLSDPRLSGTGSCQIGKCDYHHDLPKDVARLNRGGTVVAFTGSRQAITGRLSRTPSFMTSMVHRVTQELWTVVFDRGLARGDCGSIVTDLTAKEYIGHIVAGSLLSGSALIIPASDVFDDISSRSGKSLSLAADIRGAGGQNSTNKAVSLMEDKSSPESYSVTGMDLNAWKNGYEDQTTLQADTRRSNEGVVDMLFATKADVSPSLDSPAGGMREEDKEHDKRTSAGRAADM